MGQLKANPRGPPVVEFGESGESGQRGQREREREQTESKRASRRENQNLSEPTFTFTHKVRTLIVPMDHIKPY